ncbi:hypothetical protein Pedsa_3688 [Pseudopedobacter saltans DSM 12145]|uniref:Ig-like domain-containing protein n=1 Tax=Pseudopedobacter saltans (strain ATCC 51119 / DSM 12145 / JCM 21818 / CCUG 39354 / LMG 10337 / NBRC 100064 / NCIMB 13643) TaxID=762903 RepID=F0S5P3_PSESL|nr:hypothetical protein [Pseudopedobacter saltans]ADY54217.1 hypothetical protein Pedsa_3688 [Pseudopedobacter saltans DSM 12145]
MKKILSLLALCLTLITVKAAVDPTANGTILVCSGGTITVPNAPVGTAYEIAYSASQTTTPNDGITTASVGATNTSFAEKGTGYYYFATKNTTTGCISEWQEIPVYVLKPLIATIDAANNSLCIEDLGGTKALLTGNITNPEASTTGISLAYQWYTVASGTETAISGATNSTYTIPAPLSAGTYTYKLKVGYLINSGKYCSTTADKAIEILAKPTTPTISVSNVPDTW